MQWSLKNGVQCKECSAVQCSAVQLKECNAMQCSARIAVRYSVVQEVQCSSRSAVQCSVTSAVQCSVSIAVQCSARSTVQWQKMTHHTPWAGAGEVPGLADQLPQQTPVHFCRLCRLLYMSGFDKQMKDFICKCTVHLYFTVHLYTWTPVL